MKMNAEKARQKLKLLSQKDLNILYQMVQEELEERPTVMSNATHTPAEQCRSLGQMFAQAWIHG
jgi:hypothetical protein